MKTPEEMARELVLLSQGALAAIEKNNGKRAYDLLDVLEAKTENLMMIVYRSK